VKKFRVIHLEKHSSYLPSQFRLGAGVKISKD
jgi:hypothetical protein